MLQTIRWLRTLQIGGDRRPHLEDAIFGGIIGVLPYVAPQTQSNILSAILPDTLCGMTGALRDVSITSFELWKQLSEKNLRTIPDAVIKLNWRGKKYLLIIEAKWDADFSALQVAKQHLCASAVARREGREKLHLLLVRNRMSAERHIKSLPRDFGEVEFMIRTWGEVLSELASLAANSQDVGTNRWAKDAALALNSLGEKVFEGFGGLEFELGPISGGPIAFFHRNFMWDTPLELPTRRRVFWKVRNGRPA